MSPATAILYEWCQQACPTLEGQDLSDVRELMKSIENNQFNEQFPVASEQKQIAPDLDYHDTALAHQHQENPLPEGGFPGVTGKRTGPGFYGDGTGSS